MFVRRAARFILGAGIWFSAATIVADSKAVAKAETAVFSGLDYLARRQNADGGWAFSAHNKAEEKSRGDSTTHATGIALLPFLGAGQTHAHGHKFKKRVRSGIDYLLRQTKVSDQGGDLRGGGDMSSHAVAALVLCEAYAMTQDTSLKKPAQQSLRFIQSSQHKKTGGWGRQPGMAPDMHLLGWQLLALRSGHAARLEVSPATIQQLKEYLDAQQMDGGAYFGRHMRGKDPLATAIGHLGRSALQPAVFEDRAEKKPKGAAFQAQQTAIEYLLQLGPAKHDVQQNLFTSLLVFHHGGENWRNWNEKLRDQILKSQISDGVARGTWFDPRDNSRGDRLYQTAINLLNVEIYYRHLSIHHPPDSSLGKPIDQTPRKENRRGTGLPDGSDPLDNGDDPFG